MQTYARPARGFSLSSQIRIAWLVMCPTALREANSHKRPAAAQLVTTPQTRARDREGAKAKKTLHSLGEKSRLASQQALFATDQSHGDTMHYYSTPVSHSSAGPGMHVPDRRRNPRRSLACRVTVRLSKDVVLYGFSVDLSMAGIGITVPKRITAEQECNFTVSFFANGKSHRMEATGRIVSCVCSGMDGFRVGIKFTHLDANAQEIIENILG